MFLAECCRLETSSRPFVILMKWQTGTKSLIVRFIGEEHAVDVVNGPTKEFFDLYFEDAKKCVC